VSLESLSKTSPEPTKSLLEELTSLLESGDGLLDEAKKKKKAAPRTSSHNPFKYQSSNGPGPDKEFGQRTVDKANDWKCKCSNYVCRCVKGKGKGKRSKIVRIKRSYKKKYNARYKRWRAGK
jgi:hypothetical protein